MTIAFLKISGVLVATSLLAGCSSSLLGGKSGGPAAVEQVPVGNQLALPPDLQLRSPGQIAPTYQANTAAGEPVGGLYDDGTDIAAPPPKRVASAPTQDIFEQNGISRFKPDGTKKTEDELRTELKLALLAKKKQQNPNYGSVFNIGNVFKDE